MKHEESDGIIQFSNKEPRWFSWLSILFYPKHHDYILTLNDLEEKIEAQNLAVFFSMENNDNKYSI